MNTPIRRMGNIQYSGMRNKTKMIAKTIPTTSVKGLGVLRLIVTSLSLHQLTPEICDASLSPPLECVIPPRQECICDHIPLVYSGLSVIHHYKTKTSKKIYHALEANLTPPSEPSFHHLPPEG